jgi:hypothetical protein
MYVLIYNIQLNNLNLKMEKQLSQGSLNPQQQLQQLQQLQQQLHNQSQQRQGEGGGVNRNTTTTTTTKGAMKPNALTPAVPKSKNELELNVNSVLNINNAPVLTKEDSSDPLTGMVKDVVFAMIMNVPALRTKLQAILDNPSLIGAEIVRVHAELRAKLTVQELEQLNAYASQDSSRRTIVSVMQSAFTNIMADGKIDMSDAPHFLALIHDCITLFSADASNSNTVPMNSNTVISFLHFVLKCILILTLDDPEEAAALVMLDGSFKLVQLTVLPLIAGKKWCSCFS